MITTVGLDADDTLWHNETIFRLTHDRFTELLADVADKGELERMSRFRHGAAVAYRAIGIPCD